MTEPPAPACGAPAPRWQVHRELEGPCVRVAGHDGWHLNGYGVAWTSEPAAGGTTPTASPAAERHEFLPFPYGRPGCFRAVNRDGRPPRCGKPADHPVHQPATSSGDTEPAALDHPYKSPGPGAYHGTCCIDISKGPICGRPANEHPPEPTSSGQTAEHGIDTAAIRAAAHGLDLGGCTTDMRAVIDSVDDLCDALDRQREETARWKQSWRDVKDDATAEYERMEAEIRELRTAGKAAMDLYGATVIERDDARARLDEIRTHVGALIGMGAAAEGTFSKAIPLRDVKASVQAIAAILDREVQR